MVICDLQRYSLWLPCDRCRGVGFFSDSRFGVLQLWVTCGSELPCCSQRFRELTSGQAICSLFRTLGTSVLPERNGPVTAMCQPVSRAIPVIADAALAPEFGSNDTETDGGERAESPPRSCYSKEGYRNANRGRSP